MYPPILPGKGRRSEEEGADLEGRLREVSRGYEGSPWLTALVDFSGFLLAFVGTFDTLFLLGRCGMDDSAPGNLHRDRGQLTRRRTRHAPDA